jgi:hypothetical protein
MAVDPSEGGAAGGAAGAGAAASAAANGGGSAASGGGGAPSKWFHCDDSRVTEVTEEQALGAEAYLLFYVRRQSGRRMEERVELLRSLRAHMSGREEDGRAAHRDEPRVPSGRPRPGAELVGVLPPAAAGPGPTAGAVCACRAGETWLSRGWLARYLATDEPGPITHDSLCRHNGVDADANIPPKLADPATQIPNDCAEYRDIVARVICDTQGCFLPVPKPLFESLANRFAEYSPATRAVPKLLHCQECLNLHARERQELDAERKEIQELDTTEIQPGGVWFLVDAQWLSHWRAYCWDNSRTDPPGPVSNWRLLSNGRPKSYLQRADDYRGVNVAVWKVFVKRYGGGPCICRASLDIYAHAVSSSGTPVGG